MAEVKHGPSGYRNGCRCQVCRSGHAAAARSWRARRAERARLALLDDQARAQALADAAPPAAQPEQSAGLLDADLPPGPIEQAIIEDLAALVGEPPWRASLSALARANARIVDQAARHQRLDVLSGVQLRLMDILDRLRRLPVEQSSNVPTDWAKTFAADG